MDESRVKSGCEDSDFDVLHTWVCIVFSPRGDPIDLGLGNRGFERDAERNCCLIHQHGEITTEDFIDYSGDVSFCCFVA